MDQNIERVWVADERFPIKGQTLKGVSWNLVAAYEDAAQRIHGQSLVQLAERGGLTPVELLVLWQLDASPDHICEWEGDKAEVECLRLLSLGSAR